MLGTLLNHRYRVESELGRGGVGIVYRGHDILLDRDIAIKVLTKSEIGSQGRARLLHEAQAAARLNHPNIISIFDASEAVETANGEDRSSFIVMELLEGDSLYEYKFKDLSEILNVLVQVCNALEHAHAHGIIHRDLKPENVIITHQGIAKLTDFGLARSIASRLTAEGMIVGTVFYLAPEQALGRPVDARADLYSLGVLMYEIVTGRLPFQGDDPLAIISQHLNVTPIPPSTYNAEIPSDLEWLIMHLLCKQPEERPATAMEVRSALERILTGSPGTPTEVIERSAIEGLVRGRLVAREKEFAEARRIWKQTATGAGEDLVLLLSGESGVGKTPLVREIKALAGITGGQVLGGECYAEGSAPYGPFAQIIRSMMAASPNTRSAFKWENELSPIILSDLITLVPELSSHLTGQLSEQHVSSQLTDQLHLFDSIFSMVSILAVEAPLLLVIEDIQWADCGTLCLVRHLARRGRVEHSKLLILLTYREAEIDETCDLGEVLLDLNRERLAARIKLSRYNNEQTRLVLETMLQDRIDDSFSNAIYRETEGNLYFIEEMVKSLVEQGKLIRSNGHWQVNGDEGTKLPQSVRATIQARVAKLPEDSQEYLRVAAIIGREFDFDTLIRASDQDEERLIQTLEKAERAQLISEIRPRPGKEIFTFTHGLIPATIRDSMSSLRRHRLHRRVAAALESLHPEDHVTLFYHYEHGGDEEKAIQHLVLAGDKASLIYANQDAINYYSKALELIPATDPRRFELLAHRARVYDLIARRDANKADIDEMLTIAEQAKSDELKADALIAFSDYYIHTGHVQALTHAEEAQALARRIKDPVREAQALRRIGFISRSIKDLTRSRRALETSVEYFRNAGLFQEAIISLHTLSLVLVDEGDSQAAQSACREAIELSRRLGDKRQEAISIRRLAIALLEQHSYKEALPFALAALKLHQEIGDRVEECHALNVLGIIYAWEHRWEESEMHLRSSLLLSESIGADISFLYAAENLIFMHYEAHGLYEEVLDFIDQCRASPLVIEGEYPALWLIVKRAEMLSSLGCYEEGIALVEGVIGPLEKIMPGSIIPMQLHLFLARSYANIGRFDEAQSRIEDARKAMPLPDRPIDQFGILFTEALIAYLEGGEEHWRHGLEVAQRALSLVDNSAWHYEQANLLLIITLCQLQLGMNQEAMLSGEKCIQTNQQMLIIPIYYDYGYWRALSVNNKEEEAAKYLQRACEKLYRVADNIKNEKLRRSWLENVLVNRTIHEACSQKESHAKDTSL